MKTLSVGMVGYGFIGKVHSLSYLNLPYYYNPVPAKIKLAGVYSYHLENAKRGAEEASYEFATDDWMDLIKDDDIDIIEICTPNINHKQVILEALDAGKHINCEKPLALNLAEAKEILQKANKYPELVFQMCFNNRYHPMVMRAKKLIEEDFLGEVFTVRASYLHSGYIDPGRPMSWRMEKKNSGGGALFDLSSHLIDLIIYLVGDFEKINARLKIFHKKRPLPGKTGKFGTVEVDDLALMMFELKNGALGTLEGSRVATGTNDEYRVEIHGQKGAIRFNSMQPNFLEAYDVRDPSEPIGGRRGFTAIETVQRLPKPANQFPGPKFSIGWMRAHMGNAFDFITNIAEGNKPHADINAGYRVQEVLEACLESDKKDIWVKLP